MDKKAAGIRKYAKLMGNAACALSILFILAALIRTDFDFSKVTDWRIFLAVFAIGTAVKTAAVFMSAGAWCLWLEFYAQKRCSRAEALRVYAKANIGKYLPGNVMHYVERNLFAEKLELSQKQIAAASISEAASLVLAACLAGTLLSYSQMREALAAVLHRLPYVQKLLENMPGDADSGGFSAGWMFFAVAAGMALSAAAAASVIKYCCRKRRIDIRAFFHTFMACIFIYAAVLGMLGMILCCFTGIWKERRQQVRRCR